ncbi:MAG: tol-pal system protein YbgF [Thermodesulfobacteriota bacterium]
MTATMRNAISLLLLGSLAIASTGCTLADSGAFARLSDEVGVLRKEVATLKGSQSAAPSAAEGEVPALRKTVADMGADADRMRSDQLAASSRLDETQAELRRVAARQAEQEKAIQEARKGAERMQEIEKRVTALEGRAGTASGAAVAAVPAASPAPPPSMAPAWKSPEEMYEFAVGQVKAGSPKKGRETLAEFVAQNPGHKLVPNALYWKGESYYAEKDYENAILSFQDVVDKYPAGDKAPDAVYKQGMAFLALKDAKNAKILLNLVVSKYPKSTAAGLAKKKLTEIK